MTKYSTHRPASDRKLSSKREYLPEQAQQKGTVGREAIGATLQAGMDSGLSSQPDSIMQLQRLIGNQAVMRLLAEQSKTKGRPAGVSPDIQRKILEVRSTTHMRKIESNGSVNPAIARGDSLDTGIIIRVEDELKDKEFAPKSYWDKEKTSYFNVLDTGNKSRGAIKSIKTKPANTKKRRMLAALGGNAAGRPGTVKSKTQLRSGELNAPPGSDAVLIKGSSGQIIQSGEPIPLKTTSKKDSTPATYYSEDSSDVFYLVLNFEGMPRGFIRADKVVISEELPKNPAALDDDAGLAETATKSIGNAVERTYDLGINYGTAKAETTGDTAEYYGEMKDAANEAAGEMAAVTGLIGMGYAWRDFAKNPSPEGILTLFGLASGTAAGIAVAIDSGATIADNTAVQGDSVILGANHMTESYAVADLLTTEAYIFSTILSGYKAVQSLWAMWENYDQMSGGEAALEGLGAVIDVLSFTENAVKTARTILDALGTTSGAITAMLPGITSAVSVATIIIRTVDFIKAETHRRQMAYVKQEYIDSDEFAQGGLTTTETNKKTWYTMRGSYEEKESTKLNKDKLKDAKNDTMTNPALKKQIGGYQVAKDLKKINVKREQRAGVEISLELAKIAGDIAVLVGGPAAGAGATTKIVAEATLQMMPIIRVAKQKSINLAKKHGVENSYLDSKQSSKEKLATYRYNTATLFSLLAEIPQVDKSDKQKWEIAFMEYDRVEKMFKATGVDMKALYAETDHLKQFAMVVRAMKARD